MTGTTKLAFFLLFISLTVTIRFGRSYNLFL